MKIYTKTGDTGLTGLIGGVRVAKDALRVEAYGALDELNACLGLVVTALPDDASELRTVLTGLQSELFDLGAELATSPQHKGGKLVSSIAITTSAQVEALERAIDHYESAVSPLQNFILPGGSLAAAHLHLARTVARRAERRAITLAAHESLNPEVLRYLNRLSDLLFVLARSANLLAGIADVPWHARPSS